MTCEMQNNCALSLSADEIIKIARSAIIDYSLSPTLVIFDKSKDSSTEYKVCVTIRYQGRVRGCYSSISKTLKSAIILAARNSLNDSREGKRLALSELKQSVIEVWVQYSREPILAVTDDMLWGTDGFEVINDNGNNAFFLPSIPIERDIKSGAVLLEKLFLKARMLSQTSRAHAKLYKTKWNHFVEGERQAHSFYRLVVSRENKQKLNILQNAVLVANHITNIQVSEGEYLYSYDALKALRIHRRDQPVRTIGCTYALSMFLNVLQSKSIESKNREKYLTSAENGIFFIKNSFDKFGNFLTPGIESASLGSLALSILTLSYLGKSKDWSGSLAKNFTEKVLRAQSIEGWYANNIGNPGEKGTQDFSPGQSILAISQQEFIERNYVQSSIESAYNYYSNINVSSCSKFFLAWQAKAWCSAFNFCQDIKYFELALKYLNVLAQLQISSTDSFLPADFVGGYKDRFTTYNAAPPTFLVSLYTEAFLMGWAISKRLDYDDFSRSFHGHSLAGLSFLERLIILPCHKFLLREPDMAIGGVRENLTSFHLRCDYSMHALTCYSMALKYNFSEEL